MHISRWQVTPLQGRGELRDQPPTHPYGNHSPWPRGERFRERGGSGASLPEPGGAVHPAQVLSSRPRHRSASGAGARAGGGTRAGREREGPPLARPSRPLGAAPSPKGRGHKAAATPKGTG
ncbi:hypothetical protein GCM10018987_36630 [Streptomyces cremeus]